MKIKWETPPDSKKLDRFLQREIEREKENERGFVILLGECV